MSEILKAGVKIINGRLQTDTNTTIDTTTSNIAKETGGNLASILAQLDIKQSALETSLLAQEHVYSQLIAADESLATNSITLDTKGHRLLDIYASATTATTFTVDISMDNTNWVNHYTSATAETSYKSTEWNGFRYVKISAAAAGVSGTDTVTLVLGAK